MSLLEPIVRGPDFRARAARVLDRAGLDALVVASPESFRDLTGVDQSVAAFFRRAGSGFAVLPRDPGAPLGIVVGDLVASGVAARLPAADVEATPLWIETATLPPGDGPVEDRIARAFAARGAGFARPATFDLELSVAALRRILARRGLDRARLGLDLGFVPSADLPVIRAGLPGAELADGSPALGRLLAVKEPGEIARLRLAADLSRAGLVEIAARTRRGDTADVLNEHFRAGVEGAAAARGVPAPPSWQYISVGPRPWGGGEPAFGGAIVKADVGCVVDGYSSDMSRNYVFGDPPAAAARLHAILEEAFMAGLAAIGPGVAFSDVHALVTRSLRENGLAGFTRGHFGHALGRSSFPELWPFVSADSEEAFEPGMVMAFEVPLYVDGLGGFNIEDQILVTETGIERMTGLPVALSRIG